MILPIVTISVVYCSPLTHSSLAYCHSSLLGIKPQVIITMEKETATHSSILAWRIPWTEVPGGLQSVGSQRVRHDWATNTHAHNLYEWDAFIPIRQMTWHVTSFWTIVLSMPTTRTYPEAKGRTSSRLGVWLTGTFYFSVSSESWHPSGALKSYWLRLLLF